jgi:hypothetical protein
VEHESNSCFVNLYDIINKILHFRYENMKKKPAARTIPKKIKIAKIKVEKPPATPKPKRPTIKQMMQLKEAIADLAVKRLDDLRKKDELISVIRNRCSELHNRMVELKLHIADLERKNK